MLQKLTKYRIKYARLIQTHWKKSVENAQQFRGIFDSRRNLYFLALGLAMLLLLQVLLSWWNSSTLVEQSSIASNAHIANQIAERVSKSFSKMPAPIVAAHLLHDISGVNPLIRPYLLDRNGMIIAGPSEKLPRIPWVDIRSNNTNDTVDVHYGDDPESSRRRLKPVTIKQVKFGKDLAYVYVVLDSAAAQSSLYSYVLAALPSFLILLLVVLPLSFYFLKRLNGMNESISGLSHDLRGPLASIQGYIEALLRKGESMTSSERKRFLTTTLKSTKVLTATVGSVFDLSRLDQSEVKKISERLCISEVLGDLVQRYKVQAEKSGLVFTMSIPESFIWVQGSVSLLDRALSNIISNAIKYTPKNGSISIHLQASSSACQISVRDSGIGMSADDLKRLGTKSYRSNQAKAFTSGTGLGMAVTSKIIQAHGGKVAVESILGQGTSVTVSLPILKQGRNSSEARFAH